MSVRAIVLAASATGSAVSAAALYGRYRVLPGFFTGPNTCRLEQGGCAALFRTRAAALLGVPNALLGLMFYPSMAAGVLLEVPPSLLLAASFLPLAMSAFLARTLLRERLECRICWAGHLTNVVLTIGLAFLAAAR